MAIAPQLGYEPFLDAFYQADRYSKDSLEKYEVLKILSLILKLHRASTPDSIRSTDTLLSFIHQMIVSSRHVNGVGSLFMTGRFMTSSSSHTKRPRPIFVAATKQVSDERLNREQSYRLNPQLSKDSNIQIISTACG